MKWEERTNVEKVLICLSGFFIAAMVCFLALYILRIWDIAIYVVFILLSAANILLDCANLRIKPGMYKIFACIWSCMLCVEVILLIYKLSVS